MKKYSTIDLLALASLLSLLVWVGSYFFPRIPESFRSIMYGVFMGYNGSLMLALRADGAPPNQPPGA
jgi:hypothetical protein